MGEHAAYATSRTHAMTGAFVASLIVGRSERSTFILAPVKPRKLYCTRYRQKGRRCDIPTLNQREHVRHVLGAWWTRTFLSEQRAR